MTIDEVVSRWDAGESLWSVEMGGLGPGYEQAIQVLIFELLRDNNGRDLPLPGSLAIQSWGDPTVSRIDNACLGFSGAQVGAARSIAYRMLSKGYDAVLDEMRAHDAKRLIQVSNHWPRVEKLEDAQ